MKKDEGGKGDGRTPQIVVTGERPQRDWRIQGNERAGRDVAARQANTSGLGRQEGIVRSRSTSQMSPPASTSDTATGCSNPLSPNPVVIGTGEKYLEEEDFTADNTVGHALARTYRSFNNSSIMFGPKWASTYDYPALGFSGCVSTPTQTGTSGPIVPAPGGTSTSTTSTCVPTTVYMTWPDGSKYTYTRTTAGTYRVNNSAAMGTFAYASIGNTWQLNLDKKVSGSGLITSITSSGGAQLLTFTYTPGKRELIQVTNLAGQSVKFGWTGNSVTTVTDPAGSVWRYGYENGVLVSVTSPGSPTDTKTYHYENADTTLLTGVSYNGIRYSTYKYYTDKRVQESGLAGGE